MRVYLIGSLRCLESEGAQHFHPRVSPPSPGGGAAGCIATHGEPTGVSSTASICPLHRYGGKPREAEDASTGGREIDHSTARIRAPISYGNDNTAAISAVGNPHPAAERQ